MTKIYLLDDAQLQGLTEQVALCLSAKAKRELVVHDHRRRTMLGLTEFWLQLRDDGQVILCYNQHPSKWDVDAIKESLHYYETIELAEMGISLF